MNTYTDTSTPLAGASRAVGRARSFPFYTELALETGNVTVMQSANKELALGLVTCHVGGRRNSNQERHEMTTLGERMIRVAKDHGFTAYQGPGTKITVEIPYVNVKTRETGEELHQVGNWNDLRNTLGY